MGNKKRSFNSQWYKEYHWLKYSVDLDAAYCYACHHFSIRNENTFTITSFRDWKHAAGIKITLPIHARYATHSDTMKAWHEFEVNKENHTTIKSILQGANKSSKISTISSV